LTSLVPADHHLRRRSASDSSAPKVLKERLLKQLLGRVKGKPCPENVARGVHVRVGLVAARETSELLLSDAVPRRDMSAVGAPLRGVTRVHCDHCPSGTFSLGRQNAQENTPSRRSRAPRLPGGCCGRLPAGWRASPSSAATCSAIPRRSPRCCGTRPCLAPQGPAARGPARGLLDTRGGRARRARGRRPALPGTRHR
jgi:hypothetical protein